MSISSPFNPGALVRARGREWVVLPDSDEQMLSLRPLSGSDTDITRIFMPLEKTPVQAASFSPPNPNHPGTSTAVKLLHSALMLKLRSGAGPFRSFGNIAVEPRAYQLVPLLMALKHSTIRLLIADDVGIGKTVEAGLIMRELVDRGEVGGGAVLCPPHLCDQWHSELLTKFNIEAVVVRPATVGRLERGLPHGQSIFKEYPFTIISLDYIKSDRRRDEFLHACPHFVIVDEAHSCSKSGTLRHQRYTLLRELANDPERHMLFLTATPHSGDESSFSNLLALLNPLFAELMADADLDSSRRDELRRQLANHFVQRRRADIEEWQDTSLFPDRHSMQPEPTYTLSKSWKDFFEDIKRYARSLIVDASEKTSFQQRLSWWAALALLRCVSSSPAAAVRALHNRLDTLIDSKVESNAEIPVDSILDGFAEDDLTISDVEPGTLEAGHKTTIQQLIQSATKLCGVGHDPKLAALVGVIDELVTDGFAPVIFCRYIATAHYVYDELAKKFKGRTVELVTGELAPDEREQRIGELLGQRPILVATDCLSEGINLQETFDAVVHYDLSWNPTRHDQREGRVDRFGQKAKVVRIAMLYGEDNPVDGIVLDNIIKKVKRIEKELGVAVSMPDNQEKLTHAIVSGVLLKTNGDAIQENFLNLLAMREEQNDYFDTHWASMRETAKKNITRFAQRALKPADVLPEWNKAMLALGTEDAVELFVKHAAQALGTPLSETARGLHLPTEHLPPALSERVQAALLPTYFDLHYPPKRGVFVHRTHPAITALADYLAETALAQSNGALISRCGAMFTSAVTTRTALYLLRLRSQLTLKRDRFATQARQMLAEEAVIVGFRSGQALSEEEVGLALDAQPARDMVDALKTRQIQWAIDALQQHSGALESLAKQRARELLADHRRVREAAQARGSYAVEPVLPADIIGVFVLVPAQMTQGAA